MIYFYVKHLGSALVLIYLIVVPRQSLLKRLQELDASERRSAPRLGRHMVHPNDPAAQPRTRSQRAKPYKRPVRPDRSVIPLPPHVPHNDNAYMLAHPLPPRPSLLTRMTPNTDHLHLNTVSYIAPPPIPEGLNFKNEFKERLRKRLDAVQTRLQNLWNYPEYSALEPTLHTSLNQLGDKLDWLGDNIDTAVGWSAAQRQILLNGLAAFGPIDFSKPRKRYTTIVEKVVQVPAMGFFDNVPQEKKDE